MKYKIGDLKSANGGVISVHPDSTLVEATSKMLLHDFSQLPVMSSAKKIEGVISWKTIGVVENFTQRKENVKDCMDANVSVLNSTDNLLDSVNIILEKEFVFVKNKESVISGIVTLHDIAGQFKTLSEPFIELEAIETSLRKLIDRHISTEKVISFCKSKYQGRKIESSRDLTFGEYIGIIENNELWVLFDINLDRKVFIEKLETVRLIRNQVMHFRVAEFPSDQLKNLKDVSKFFRKLEKIFRV